MVMIVAMSFIFQIEISNSLLKVPEFWCWANRGNLKSSLNTQKDTLS
jgi:hypothetical protein